jgi:hypothetical protein
MSAQQTEEILWPGPERVEPVQRPRPRSPRRRVRGLRFPVLPTGALMAQVSGAVAALSGVYLLLGIAATLIAGGVAAVVLGALKEAGKV